MGKREEPKMSMGSVVVIRKKNFGLVQWKLDYVHEVNTVRVIRTAWVKMAKREKQMAVKNLNKSFTL